MPLADIATAPPKRSGYDCSVGKLLNTLQALDTGEHTALQGMLANPDWSSDAIYAACSDEGYSVARQSIGRHRRGSCRCGTGK
jgi:hypothetical protein